MDEVSLRVGDSERWAVDARLQQAVGDGLLTLAEYDERAGLVWQARTRPELDAVTRDLPAPAPVSAPVPARERGGRRPRARRVLAVMSGDELTGPVVQGQAVEAYALMGGAAVDLRRDDLPAHVRVRAVAVMGGVEVVVPRGVSVHLTGLSLMGGRTLNDLDPPRPGAPVVHLSGWALMGGVVVGHGPNDRAVSVNQSPGPALPGQAAPGQPEDHGGSSPAGSRPLTSGPGAEPGGGLSAAGSRALTPGLRHRRSRLRSGVVGLVAAAAVGAAVVGSNDAVSVFGSTVHRVQATDREVSVASAFGSVTVVVPDNARVTSHGVVVFGGSDCEACGRASTGRSSRSPIDVGAYGAFGSVQVLTEQQYEQERRDDGD